MGIFSDIEKTQDEYDEIVQAVYKVGQDLNYLDKKVNLLGERAERQEGVDDKQNIDISKVKKAIEALEKDVFKLKTILKIKTDDKKDPLILNFNASMNVESKGDMDVDNINTNINDDGKV